MPAKKTIKILGLEIDNITMNNVLEEIEKSLNLNNRKLKIENRILQIATINPEILMLALENPFYKEMLNRAKMRVADGIGIILAGKIFGNNFKERITGLALVKKLCGLGASEGFVIGLIGGQGKIAVKCGECLQRLYPNLKWWGEEGPEIKDRILDIKDSSKNFQFSDSKNEKQTYNFNALIDKINRNRTRILFCAFGAPKQEFFINALRQYENKLHQPLAAIGVGGVFDEIGGAVSPAPEWIDKIGLKWFWRLIHQPWRWKRQLALLKFGYQILLARFSYNFLYQTG